MPDSDASVDLTGLAGPEAPSVVAGIGLAVWEAIAEDPLSLHGALTSRDIVLDGRGEPVVSPTGRSASDLPDPERHYAAPEVRAGGPPTHEAALWGLGLVLYRLATGLEPAVPPGRTEPPRASMTRSGIPPALDDAIARLLQPMPGQRHTALPLLHELAAPLPDLRTLMPQRPRSSARDASASPPTVGEVRVTARGGEARSGTVDEAPVRGLLTLPAQAATPAALSAAAGELGVAVRTLKELSAAGTAIPVQAGLRGRALRQGADDAPLPLVPSSAPGPALPVLAVSAGLMGGGLLVVGMALLVVQTLVGLGIAAVGALALLGAILPLLFWVAQWTSYRRTASTWTDLQRQRRQLQSHAVVGGAWERLARARRHLGSAEHLPDAAEADVRAGLDDLEDHLVALAARADRLAALDQDAGRQALEAEARQVEVGLDELDALLVQADTGASVHVGGALDRVMQTARLAAQSVLSSGSDPARPPPRREPAR